MNVPASFLIALHRFDHILTSRVDRLRADAARIDADFAEQERRAASNLAAIRQRNAIDASKRVLAHESGASLACVHCIEAPVKRHA